MSSKSPYIRMRDVSRVYDELNIGIIITNNEGVIIWGNRYYSKLAQFDIRTYFGRNVREISQREDVALPTESYIIDTVLRTRQSQTEVVRYRTTDYVLTTAIPIFNENKEIDFVIYSITNYSELMNLQEAVSRSTMQALALETHLRNIQIHQNIGKDIIISDKQMFNIYGKALRLAPTSVSVMLTGESGTGKDVLAKFIHQSSQRKDENFIHVNMATIPPALFESELFGYAPGSFTGAAKNGKDGLIQLANRGTLFLDEIGELPLDIQAKLLKVIGDFERISDHTVGIMEAYRTLQQKDRKFSNKAQVELDIFARAVANLMDITLEVFDKEDAALACEVQSLSQVITELGTEVRTRHIKRLRKGKCTIEMGFLLSDIVTGCERIAAHCAHIVVSVIEVREESLEIHEHMNEFRGNKSEEQEQLYQTFRGKYVLP